MSSLPLDLWIRQSGVPAAKKIQPNGARHSTSRSCGFSIVRASHPRAVSVGVIGCHSNVMPTGFQIASASAKIRLRSDSLKPAGAVTATDIGMDALSGQSTGAPADKPSHATGSRVFQSEIGAPGGGNATAAAPITTVTIVANTMAQLPHTIFVGSLRSARRRTVTVPAPSSDPETWTWGSLR